MKKYFIVLMIVYMSVFLYAAGQKSMDEASYPMRPIKLIVPWGAGGGADISTRLLSKYAEKELGQAIVVSNITGGSGTIGYTALADAKNDGYTIGYFSSPDSNGNLLFDGIRYTVDSFVPLIQYAADPHIIVASKKSNIKNVNDLIKAAQEHPEKITFGLGGAWTSHDFLRANLEKKAGISFKRVVFQGGAAAVNAVASGDCDIAVPFVAEALPQIEAGNVVPIAITSKERFENNSNIPTVKEEGFDFSHTMWRGLMAPSGVPTEVVQALSDAFVKAYNNPDYQKEAKKAGIFINLKDNTEFSSFYMQNHELYKQLIEDTK